jgi:hypothetical protein
MPALDTTIGPTAVHGGGAGNSAEIREGASKLSTYELASIVRVHHIDAHVKSIERSAEQ